jgi:homoserine kinase
MHKTIRVKAPATVSNLNCGFDVLGLALHEPYDIIEIELTDTGKVEIAGIKGCDSLSADPDKNVVGAVLKAVLAKTTGHHGFRVFLEKGIAPGSGIGSSGASSAAAAYGAGELLGRRFKQTELVEFAMEGERLASGSAHADNVAPAIFGGITLVRSCQPLDIVQVNVPSELFCVVILPDTEIKTSFARDILDRQIPLETAVRQWGNVGGLIAGLYSEDYDLVSRSLTDYVAEPRRAGLIPGFSGMKVAALGSGALGAGISGSGPSVFALCRGEVSAGKVLKAMETAAGSAGPGFKSYLSPVSRTGAVTCQMI